MVLKRQPAYVRVLQDFLRLLFALILIGSLIAPIALLPRVRSFEVDLIGRLVSGFFAQFLALWILRLVVPVPKTGSFLIGANAGYLRFACSAALVGVAMHPLIRGPYWFLHFGRFLYLRALGARIAWGAEFPADLSIGDPSLLTLESGAHLEPGVVIENAAHAAGRVRVERVTVGGGSLVGCATVLMPGVAIGHDARISPAAYIGFNARIGVGARVGERAFVADGADIGSYAVIGGGAQVPEGLKVGDRAKVRFSSILPAGQELGEREVWSGGTALKVSDTSEPAADASPRVPASATASATAIVPRRRIHSRTIPAEITDVSPPPGKTDPIEFVPSLGESSPAPLEAGAGTVPVAVVRAALPGENDLTDYAEPPAAAEPVAPSAKPFRFTEQDTVVSGDPRVTESSDAVERTLETEAAPEPHARETDPAELARKRVEPER